MTLSTELAEETERLLRFSAGSLHPKGGFAWLNDDGDPDLDRPVETWITCRMTHVLSLGVLLGHDEYRQLVDHGVEALATLLHDDVHGGWFAASDRPGAGEKRAYDHAFVALAASSAVLAGSTAAVGLLTDATTTILDRFWDESVGRVSDVWSCDWSSCEPYRGANANMHTVEAFLALADVTANTQWLDRAYRIASFFIDGKARTNDWRIPEHYSADWTEFPDYNRDDPAHKFRPFGATPGHGFEWSRLLLHLHASPGFLDAGWLLDAARGLFDRAVADGWRDGGFVYTTDWDGMPVVGDRLHWVLCEAIAAAGALHEATGEGRFGSLVDEWWSLAKHEFIDSSFGSWHHQLDAANRPVNTVWPGKPDTYHAVQATLLPRLPLAPSLASALANDLLR